MSKRRGSVRLKLDLTPEQCERLQEAFKRGELRSFDVIGVRSTVAGKILSAPTSPDMVMILDLLRYEGPLTAQEISRSLGTPLARTKLCLRFLEGSSPNMVRKLPGSHPHRYEAV